MDEAFDARDRTRRVTHVKRDLSHRSLRFERARVCAAFVLVFLSSSAVHAEKDTPKASDEKTDASSEAETLPVDGPREPVRVVVPDFVSLSEDITDAEVETITATVVYQLSLVQQLRIVSAADIRHMLDLEADKQVMGCSESTSCLSEIADALDAPLLVAGQIARLGGRMSVSLTLIDAPNATVIERAQTEARDLSALTRALKPAVSALVQKYGGIPGASDEASGTTLMRALTDRANDPDTVMLFAMMVLGVVSPFFLPIVFVLPIAQAVVLWTLGDDIAGREYPWWLLAIPAGYAALIAGLVVSSAFSAAAYSVAPLSTETSLVLSFAGMGSLFLTIFVVEPLIVWTAGTLFARDVDFATLAKEKKARAAERENDDDAAEPSEGAPTEGAPNDAPPSFEAEPSAGDPVRSLLRLW